MKRPRLASGALAIAAATAIAVSAVVVAARSSDPAESSSRPVAVTSSTPVPRPLTPALAAQAFRDFVGNDDVARASGDERLALSWRSEGQVALTAAEFRKAKYAGEAAARYRYGTPKLYVPRLKVDDPHWFVAVVTRYGPGTKDKRTAFMGFASKKAGARWKLSVSALAEKGAKLPKFVVDRGGYAVPLATHDSKLLVPPRLAPAMQATLAEEGAGSPAAKVMATGEFTSGYHARDESAARKLRKQGLIQNTIYAANSARVFPLRTTNGGFVLYALTRDARIYRKNKKKGAPVPITSAAQHLADPSEQPREIDITEMLQFATVIPLEPKDKDSAGRADIIGYAAAPVKVTEPKR